MKDKVKVTKKNGVTMIKEDAKESKVVKLESKLNNNKTVDKVKSPIRFSKIIPSTINNILNVAFVTDGFIDINDDTIDEVMEDLLEQKIHTARSFDGIKRDDNDIVHLDKAIFKLMLYRDYIYKKSKK